MKIRDVELGILHMISSSTINWLCGSWSVGAEHRTFKSMKDNCG